MYHYRRRGRRSRRRGRRGFRRLVVEIPAAQIGVWVVFYPVPGDTGIVL
jgi:hypothetical protein